MATIICMHGIGQQLKGEETLAMEWNAALRDGMRRAGAAPHELLNDDAIAVAFYGDLFRETAFKSDESAYAVADIEEGLETDLVLRWYQEAGPASLADSKSAWAPETVQEAAVALLQLPFFAGLTESLFVAALKQVSAYLKDPLVRQRARGRLSGLFSADTRLVIGHSLGSIVAYEALCHCTTSVPPAFLSLGSPLGLPNLIFHRLDPSPQNGRGHWPTGLKKWVNIADRHDIVAAVKKLRPLFGPGVEDIAAANERLAHDAQPYLTARETGAAIVEALRG